jgi:hypothetical protein
VRIPARLTQIHPSVPKKIIPTLTPFTLSPMRVMRKSLYGLYGDGPIRISQSTPGGTGAGFSAGIAVKPKPSGNAVRPPPAEPMAMV